MKSTADYLATELRVAFDDFLRTLALLERGEIENGRLESGWSPKALVAHIAFWDQIQTRRMQDAIAGTSAQSGFVPPAQTNDERSALDASRSLDEILDAADRARGELIRLVETLTPAQMAHRFPEGESTLAPMRLAEHMVNHTRQHTRQLWRYCGSMQRWQRSSLRAFLARQDANLMDSIGGLSEQALVAPETLGAWSIRDVLVHILAWREYGYLVARQWPDVNPAAIAPWIEGETVDVINGRLLRDRAALNMIDIADGLTTYHRRMLKLFDQASSEWLASTGAYGGEEEGELSGFLYGLTLHEMEHAEAIWQFKVGQK